MKFATAATAATGLVLAPFVSAQSNHSCAAAGVRNQGAYGYAAVQYKSCCPGLVQGSVAGEWGKFCLAPGGDAPAPGGDAPASNCYKAGERSQGASGYPAVQWKPCCDGSKSTTVDGEWGKFCPGGGGKTPTPTPSNCYQTGERNQGASGYAAVQYKPCCDGDDVSVEKAGTWGFFCTAPGTVVEPTGPTEPDCYKTGERKQGASGYPAVQYKPCCDKDDASAEKEGTWGLFCTAPGTTVEPTQPAPTEPTPTEPTPTEPTPTEPTPTEPTPTEPTPTQPAPTEPTPTEPTPTEPTPTEPTPTEPTPTEPTPTEPTPTEPTPTQPAPTEPTPTEPTPTEPAPTGACEGLNSQRPHLLTISDDAWSLYERAVLALKESGVWDRFVSIHSANAGTAHGGSNFLVWHRAYLWELEKELDAAVSGARIPWYDWSSIDNPLTSGVWAANRLGSANTDGAGAISNGPFQGFDSQLTRDGNLDVAIPDRQFIVDGINGGLDYAAFNNWLEVLHGSFHVAVGGSMGQIPPAPRDPVFFTHHAYVDSIYREWQNAGGGNQFTGAHSGTPVTAQSVMEPFDRQAGGVLAGISNCVSYVGGGSTISRQVVFGEEIAVAQGAIRGGDGDVVKKITKEIKTNLQLVVAEKKIQNPSLYKFEVKEAVEKVASVKKAALAFGISPASVVAFEKTMAVLKLQNGIDIAEPEVVDETDAEVQAEGEAEVLAITTGQVDLLKPSKLLESASNTITTID